jgi:hypothetical protein
LYFSVSGNFHEYFIVISLLSFHSENNPSFLEGRKIHEVVGVSQKVSTQLKPKI